ncbi:MAG TPA: cytochrome c-type biogenesis protein CcmH [Anaerolineaceae bacterium]|nr:cytochrome c-type biogenesis protein CcmH [Anaerolineaceae bacterium]
MSSIPRPGFHRNLLWLVLAAALGLPLLFNVRQAVAQRPTPSDDEVNAVAHQLYCPVCENIPLDVCPTQACAQWRDLIRQKLADGWSEQQIKDYFVVQYGDRVLAEPPRRGLNWVVYVLPPLIILGGGILIFFVLRRMRAGRPASAAMKARQDLSLPPEEEEYVRRLEEELRNRER